MTRRSHFILAALLLGAAYAHADPVITAEWETSTSSYGSFGGTGLSQARGQTFEATEGGQVVSIELQIARTSDHSEPLVVALFDVDAGGRPVGDALMSQEFPASAISDDDFAPMTAFAIDSGAPLLSGQRYAITFRPRELDPDGNNYVVRGGVNDGATYEPGTALRSADGGATWVVSETADWTFRVSVEGATPVELVSWGSIKGAARR